MFSVPALAVDPEVMASLADLKANDAFGRMLERLAELMPEVHRVHAWRMPPYEPGEDPAVMIDAYHGGPDVAGDPRADAWERWKIAAFPADIWRHFTLTLLPDSTDER